MFYLRIVLGQIDPVIFVPWIVNEELDFIKDDPRRSNIKTQARQAIKFIAGVLSSKNSRFQSKIILICILCFLPGVFIFYAL